MKQEEVDNYCARVPVNRLVLACHGIGQKLAVSNIAHDAACMRLIMRQLSQVNTQTEFRASCHRGMCKPNFQFWRDITRTS